MKHLIGVVLLALLAACSSQRMDRKISDASWDSMAEESFIRWGDNRLKDISAEHPVAKCYQGKTKETLEGFKKEYLTKSKEPYYWLHIGNCYFVDNAWSKAEFFYRMAMEENKSPVIKSIALNNLGLISFKYEQWEKGKEYLKQASALAPSSKVPRYNMSQLYLQFGHYDMAIETLGHPSFRGKPDVDVYFSLANAYLYKGDLNKSSEFFALIPKGNLRREDIAATYALFLIKNGKIKEANNIMNSRYRSGVPEVTAISHKIEKILAQKLKEESQ
jgi:tetratricopeptide (TPR) repeat protein